MGISRVDLGRLSTLKRDIEAAVAEEQQARGQLEAHMSRLKEMGYKSLAAADKDLHKLQADLIEREKQINEAIDKLARDLEES